MSIEPPTIEQGKCIVSYDLDIDNEYQENGSALWHTKESKTLLEELNSSPHGLSEGEAVIRFDRSGPNRLPQPEPPTIGEVVLRQFKGPLICILAFAAFISPLIKEISDASFIAADSYQCNAEWVWRGGSVDVALLVLGYKMGLTRESLLEWWELSIGDKIRVKALAP